MRVFSPQGKNFANRRGGAFCGRTKKKPRLATGLSILEPEGVLLGEFLNPTLFRLQLWGCGSDIRLNMVFELLEVLDEHPS